MMGQVYIGRGGTTSARIVQAEEEIESEMGRSRFVPECLFVCLHVTLRSIWVDLFISIGIVYMYYSVFK